MKLILSLPENVHQLWVSDSFLRRSFFSASTSCNSCIFQPQLSLSPTFAGERESIPDIAVYVPINFHSHQEKELGRGADNQGWQIKSLATCVP